MKQFWEDVIDLLRESVLVQAITTMFLTVIVGVLVLQGRDVPDVISLALGTVMGFWFKTKRTKDDLRTYAAMDHISQAAIVASRAVLPETCDCQKPE